MAYWGTALGENDKSWDLFEDFKEQMVGLPAKKEAAVMEISRYFNRDNVIYAEWLEDRQEFGFVEAHLPHSKDKDYPDILLPVLGFFKILMEDVHYGRYVNRRHAKIAKKYAKRLLRNHYLNAKFKPSLRKFIKRLNRNYGLLRKFEVIQRKPATFEWITEKRNYFNSINYKRIRWMSDDAETQFKNIRMKQYSYVELKSNGKDVVILIWKDQKGRKLELVFTGKKAVKE